MPIDPRSLKVKKFRDIKSSRVKYERAAEFAKDVALSIAEGQTTHALLSGNFIFGDFLEALAVENGVKFKKLTFSTLAMSDENVMSLSNMLKTGWLESLDMVLSSYFWAHNRQNAAFIYEYLCDPYPARLAIAGIHTKVALIETGKSKIVIHGSANMRSSRTVEEITIEHNPELFNFHNEWHQEILDEYQVTKREKRASELWNMVGKNE